MGAGTATGDVVATWADAEGLARPPLLVLEPLTAFLDAHGIGSGPLEAAPVGHGHSNVTYAVTRSGPGGPVSVVVRRPPRPPIAPSAHDVLREARVLAALAGRARVPRVLAVCADPAVLGCPFYVMEHVRGEVLVDALPPGAEGPGAARAVADGLVDALVEVHAVDWAAAGLADFGRPEGYLARQVRRFLGLWEHHRTRDLPAVERVADWLGRTLPASGPATVVHGDYRLGNALFTFAGGPRLAAVLDWEMSTLGDPLADVGYLCALWTQADDPPTAFELSPVTRTPGFPGRAELVARYEERSGRPMTDIRWYTVLALWKSAVFMEGNYRRAIGGGSDDEFNRSFGAGVVELADRAEALSRM